jgi:hypothetical protein
VRHLARAAAREELVQVGMRYSEIALRRDTVRPSPSKQEVTHTAWSAAARAIGSAGERLVHTEEVTGSIPVSPTEVSTYLTDELAQAQVCRPSAKR